VPIGRTVAQRWPFFIYSRWRLPPSWILKVEIFSTYGPVQRADMHQRAKFCANLSNFCGDMADFRFFKMAAIRHLDLFCVYLDHPRRAFVGLCHCAKFGWNRCSSFDNMPVLMFCEFGLKMPIHAPFWVVFGGFDPLDRTQYQPILQKFHLRVIAVPAVYYLCWCL